MKLKLIFLLSLFLSIVNHTIFTMEEKSCTPEEKFYEACAKGNMDEVRKILDKEIFLQEILDEALHQVVKKFESSFEQNNEQAYRFKKILRLIFENSSNDKNPNRKRQICVEKVFRFIERGQIDLMDAQEILALFIQKGFVLETINYQEKDTILHSIVKASLNDEYDPFVLETLLDIALEVGINPNEKNNKNRSPLDYIIDNENRQDNMGKKLRSYGAKRSEQLGLNNNQESKDTLWSQLKPCKTEPQVSHQDWEKKNTIIDDSIREIYRYAPCYMRNDTTYHELLNNDNSNDISEDDSNDNSENIILILVAHGTGWTTDSGCKNRNYYDHTAAGFAGIMKFAEEYLKLHHKQHDKKKIVHLVSFVWSGGLTDMRARKKAANKLEPYLKKYYSNAELVFLGHSHGCNILNFVSHMLDGKKIKLLIYFAPPCRQEEHEETPKDTGKIIDKIKNSTKNGLKKVDVLGHAYKYLKNYMANVPTNYERLLVFHSPNDKVVGPGSVDGFSAGFAVITTGAVVYKLYKTVKSENNVTENSTSDSKSHKKEIMLAASITMYSTTKAYSTIKNTMNNAHCYTDIIPTKENGPKIHIETQVNRTYIGHSSTPLLQYFSYAYNQLIKHYPLYMSCSSHFELNINCDEKNDESVEFQNCQLFLKKFPYVYKGQHGEKYGFERDDELALRETDYYKTAQKKVKKTIKKMDREKKVDKSPTGLFEREQQISIIDKQEYENFLPKTINKNNGGCVIQ